MMDRNNKMPPDPNNPNRPTGTVPKPKTWRESVPREIVAPIRRDRQMNSIPNNLVLLNWQNSQSQLEHNQRAGNINTLPPVEGICFEQGPDEDTGYDNNWLPLVRPQVQNHKRGNSQIANNMSGLSNNISTHSSNTAIVMPTTPNTTHPVMNRIGPHSDYYSNGNFSGHNNPSRGISDRNEEGDRMPPPPKPDLPVEDRLGQIREYIKITSNLMDTVSETGEQMDSRLDQTASEHMHRFSRLVDLLGRNDQLAPDTRPQSSQSGVTNHSLNNLKNTTQKCEELKAKKDFSGKKIKLLQNQHAQLLRIQESAKKELLKIQKANESDIQSQSQQMVPLATSSNYPTPQNHSEYSYQPVNSNIASFVPYRNNNNKKILYQQNPTNDDDNNSDNDQNNLNISNDTYMTDGLYNCNGSNDNTDYNNPNYITNMENVQQLNYNNSIHAVPEISNNHKSNDLSLMNNEDIYQNPPTCVENLSDNLSNLSRRIMAVDAIMETRAELEMLSNTTFSSEQNLYENKLRELQSKKQQMDSLVADLQALNSQATLSRNSLDQQQTESVQRNVASVDSRRVESSSSSEADGEHDVMLNHVEGQISDVEQGPMHSEIAQITNMKAQLSRLKDMMETMNYIEARVENESQSSSRQGSICHQGALRESQDPPHNFHDNWRQQGTTAHTKKNNVNEMIPDFQQGGGGGTIDQVSFDGLSVDTVQAMTQDLRNQALALALERDRLVSAQAQLANRGRPDYPSPLNTHPGVKPKKRTNHTPGPPTSIPLVKPCASSRPVQNTQQRQMLLKELEVKKLQLEELMRKDRGQAHSLNQDSLSSVNKPAMVSPTSDVTWTPLQRPSENVSETPKTKESHNSLESLEVNQSRRSLLENRDNAIMSRDNTRSSTVNSTVNSTPAMPPAMDPISWRKISEDSAQGRRWACSDSVSNRQGSIATSLEQVPPASTSQQFWQQKALQLQNQLELTTNLMQSMMQSQNLNPGSLINPNISSRNSAINPPHINALNINYPVPNNLLSQMHNQSINAIGIPNAYAPMPPVLQFGILNNDYQQYMNMQSLCASVSQCCQLLWMQQRELSNLGSAVISLQERILNTHLNDSTSTASLNPNNTSRALPSYMHMAPQCASHSDQPQRAPVKITHTQSATQCPQYSFPNSSISSQVLQDDNVLQIDEENTSIEPVVSPLSEATNIRVLNNNSNMNLTNNHLQNAANTNMLMQQNANFHNTVNNLNQTDNNAQNNTAIVNPNHSGNMNNIQHPNNQFNNTTPITHNPNLFQDQSLLVQNNTNPNSLLNLFQNQPPVVIGQTNSGSVTTQSYPSPSHSVPALNNQVPPGNRANNYWDNFRSYSRQNLLSGNTKSNEGFGHSANPLVERSHNSLRPLLSLQPQTSTPKLNTVPNNTDGLMDNTIDINGGIKTPRIFTNPINIDTPPDVLNIIQNNSQSVIENSESENISRTALLNVFGNTISNLNQQQNIPEIVQSHSSRLVHNEVNFNTSPNESYAKANLIKSSGANKKRTRMNNSHSEKTVDITNSSQRLENRDLNLASATSNREQKATTKLFEELRENVYSEVAAFISLNETRPHFLIQLFRDLRQVSSDPLRQRTLQSIQELVSKYIEALHQQESGSIVQNEALQQNMAIANEHHELHINGQPSVTSSGELQDEIATSSNKGGVTILPRKLIASKTITDAAEGVSACCNNVSTSANTNGHVAVPSGYNSTGTCESHACGSSVGASCIAQDHECCNNESVSNPKERVSRQLPLVFHSPNSSDGSYVQETVRVWYPEAEPTNASYDSSANEPCPEEMYNDDVRWTVTKSQGSQHAAVIRGRFDLRNSMASVSSDAIAPLDTTTPCNEDLAEADQMCGNALEEHFETSDASSSEPGNTSMNRESQLLLQRSTTDDMEEVSSDEAVFVNNHPSNSLPDLARVGPGGDVIPEADTSWSVLVSDQGLDRVPTRLSTAASNGASRPQTPRSLENQGDQ